MASESLESGLRFSKSSLFTEFSSQNGRSQFSEASDTGVSCVPRTVLSPRFLLSLAGPTGDPKDNVGGLDLHLKLENMEDKLKPCFPFC